jgi:hypothetical protein
MNVYICRFCKKLLGLGPYNFEFPDNFGSYAHDVRHGKTESGPLDGSFSKL